MKTQNINQAKVNSNLLADRIWQGASAFVLLALAYSKVYEYVRAGVYIREALAAAFIGLCLYMLLAPLFRK